MSRHGEQDAAWLEWLAQRTEWECLVCGRRPEVCHLDSAGMGGGQGSDYWVLPLCHQHHMESHQRPALWYTHRRQFAEWWYRLHALRARYVEVESG